MPSYPYYSGLAFLLALQQCVEVVKSKGLPADIPVEEWDLGNERIQKYVQEVLIETGGAGAGIAVILGFILFVSWIFCLCRCKKIRKRDEAIEEGVFNGDKNISSLYPYHDVEVVMRKQRRVLWIGTFVLLLGYMICAGLAYKSVKDSKSTYDKIITGADTLFDEAQNAICTNGDRKVNFNECEDGSVGHFLETIKEEVGEILDNGLDIIDTMGESVAIAGDFHSHLSKIKDTFVTMEGGVDDISTNLAVAQSALSAQPSGADVIDMPPIGIPDDVTGQLQNAQTVVDSTIAMLQEAETDLHQTLLDDDSQVGRFRLMIDHIHGNELDGDTDLRAEVMDVISTGEGELGDITDQISDFRTEQLDEIKGTYDSQFQTAALIALALLALPGILLLLLSVCAMTIRSPKPFYCSMTFGFFALGIYCLFGGLFLLIHKISTDACDNIDTLLVTNLRDSFEFTAPNGKIIQSPPLGEAAIALSQCQGRVGDEPNETNNYIGILEMGDFFDISDKLAPANDAFEGALTTIKSQDSLIDDISMPINGIPQEFGLDAEPILEGCSEAIEKSSALLSELPPATFDRDDPEQVALFENYYMSGNFPEVTFTWNKGASTRRLSKQSFIRQLIVAPGTVYSSNVNTLSTILQSMEQNNNFIACGDAAGGFFDEFSGVIDSGDPPLPYSFVRTLDLAKYCAPGSGAFLSADNEIGAYYPTCYLYKDSGFTTPDLCSFATGYLFHVDVQTKVINEIETKNTELVDAVNAFGVAISNVKDGVILQQTEVNNIGEEKEHLIAGVETFANFFSQIYDDISVLQQNVLGLNDVVDTVDEFTMCGYLGDAYNTMVEEALCTDLMYDVRTMAVLLIFVAVLMVVGFCFHGIYAVSLRKRIIPGGTRSRDFDNGITIQTTTPPVSPTEIAPLGKMYPTFDAPILISPQASNDFQKPPPYSPTSDDDGSCVTEPASPHPLI